MKEIQVIKRNGKLEPLELEKIHKVVFWGCEGINNVSASDIEMKSSIEFKDKMTTQEIHATMVKSAANLISEEQPNYQYVAARLKLFNLRKVVLGQFEPIPVLDLVKQNTKRKYYTTELLENYDLEEWEQINKIIDHTRDFNLTYAGIEQIVSKYLVQDRISDIPYETPQYMYLLIAATMFMNYPKDIRLKYVKDYYDAISKFDISLPTPILAGMRTPIKQFSSCVLIESGDSLNTIISTSSAIIKYVANKAGIGIGAGRIRALGAPIRNGDVYHTGVTPFYKLFESSVKSVNQGGVRAASATLHHVIWHYEIEDMLVLKNNKGTEDNRVRRLDYSVQTNEFFYKKLINNEDITLFSPNDVPDLYDAFFDDQELFVELYEKYERKTSIMKKTVSAKKLFSTLATERAETGRIYIMNVDNVNDRGSFINPIRLSNLCQEIVLPTEPLEHLLDPDGEIALCTLSAINLGNIKSLDDLEKICDLTVRALDELLDYQTYLLPAAEHATKRRSLGIGVTNLAYYIAKQGFKYSDDSALELIDETFEAFQYYLLKASNQLAKEKSPCEYFDKTTYSKGVLPIDNYKSYVDTIIKRSLKYDWETLREDIKHHGLRHSTLSAQMPCESSSLTLAATNGIEPPRGAISIKVSKQGVLKQLVPEYNRLKNKYEWLWDMPTPEGYLKIVAVMQKYIDQSISANTTYNPTNYPDNKVPLSVILKDILLAYKLGIKTLYYHNTRDGRDDKVTDDESGCDSGACAI